jgi:hypothetical protein
MFLVHLNLEKDGIWGEVEYDSRDNLSTLLFNKDISVSAEGHHLEETSLDYFISSLTIQLPIFPKPGRDSF